MEGSPEPAVFLRHHQPGVRGRVLRQPQPPRQPAGRLPAAHGRALGRPAAPAWRHGARDLRVWLLTVTLIDPGSRGHRHGVAGRLCAADAVHPRRVDRPVAHPAAGAGSRRAAWLRLAAVAAGVLIICSPRCTRCWCGCRPTRLEDYRFAMTPAHAAGRGPGGGHRLWPGQLRAGLRRGGGCRGRPAEPT